MSRQVLWVCLWICFTFGTMANVTPKPCPDQTPSSCKCSLESLDRTIVSCLNSSWTSIPDTVPPATHTFIRGNTIAVLTKFPLAYNTTSIEKLNLENNGIHYINADVFKTFPMLEELDLSLNNLVYVNSKTFEGLTKLKGLYLAANFMHYIPADTFSGKTMPMLTHLHLDNLDLYVVEDGFVSSLANLEVLTMSGNKMRVLPVLSCDIYHLTKWDLSSNRIESANYTSNCAKPIYVGDLRLSYNKITALSADFFGHLLVMQHSLQIQHNLISEITDHFMRRESTLKVVDVSHNKLSRVSDDSLPWDQLVTVRLQDNPWDCQCGSYLFWTNYDSVRNNSVRNNSVDNHDNAVRCATPEIYFNISVYSVGGSQKCTTSHAHVANIAISISMCVGGLFFILFICYRIRKRNQKKKESTVAWSTNHLPEGTLTSAYGHIGNDVTIGTEHDNNTEPQPTTYSDRKPLEDELQNFSIG